MAIPIGAEPARERATSEYADGLDALAAELRQGLAAMAANDLVLLNDSVRRQEDLCGRLQQAAQDAPLRQSFATLAGSRVISRAGARVASAEARLGRLTAESTLVIASSMQSVRLLTSLYSRSSGYPLCSVAQAARLPGTSTLRYEA